MLAVVETETVLEEFVLAENNDVDRLEEEKISKNLKDVDADSLNLIKNPRVPSSFIIAESPYTLKESFIYSFM
jgi:hypothetical protein